MKVIRPATIPISKAKCSPTSAERDHVVEAEQQADDQLPAHESGNRSIDIARDLAHRFTVAGRHPAIQA